MGVRPGGDIILPPPGRIQRIRLHVARHERSVKASVRRARALMSTPQKQLAEARRILSLQKPAGVAKPVSKSADSIQRIATNAAAAAVRSLLKPLDKAPRWGSNYNPWGRNEAHPFPFTGKGIYKKPVALKLPVPVGGYAYTRGSNVSPQNTQNWLLNREIGIAKFKYPKIDYDVTAPRTNAYQLQRDILSYERLRPTIGDAAADAGIAAARRMLGSGKYRYC